MRMRSLLVAIVGMTLLGAGLAACGDDDASFAVGSRAPDFTLSDSVGGTVALSDYAGDPLLLYFHMADG